MAQASALRQRLRELGVSADRPSARIVQNYVELFEPPSSPWRRGWGTYRLRVGRPEPLWRLLHAASAAMVSF